MHSERRLPQNEYGPVHWLLSETAVTPGTPELSHPVQNPVLGTLFPRAADGDGQPCHLQLPCQQEAVLGRCHFGVSQRSGAISPKHDRGVRFPSLLLSLFPSPSPSPLSTHFETPPWRPLRPRGSPALLASASKSGRVSLHEDLGASCTVSCYRLLEPVQQQLPAPGSSRLAMGRRELYLETNNVSFSTSLSPHSPFSILPGGLF